MDDSAGVGRLEGPRDLEGDPEGLGEGQGAVGKPVGQRRAFDELHDQGFRVAVGLEAVELTTDRTATSGARLRYERMDPEMVGVLARLSGAERPENAFGLLRSARSLLKKLEYYHAGGSDKQLRDIAASSR